MLQRMKALATQANSGSVSDAERGFINQEYQALNTQIDEIANNTKFNGQALLNGSAGKTVGGAGLATLDGRGVSVSLNGNPAGSAYTLEYAQATGTFTLTDTTNSRAFTAQVDTSGVVIDGNVDFKAAGVNVSLKNFDDSLDLASTAFSVTGSGQLDFQVGVTQGERIAVNISNVTTGAAGLGTTGSSLATQAGAQTAATAVDTAISRMNTARANNGSLMSRFEFASANLATQVENLDAARSTLMDVDVANEMTKFSSANVLQQAATAMLAQANQMPQDLLRLLQ
jgi:flagellin